MELYLCIVSSRLNKGIYIKMEQEYECKYTFGPTTKLDLTFKNEPQNMYRRIYKRLKTDIGFILLLVKEHEEPAIKTCFPPLPCLQE